MAKTKKVTLRNTSEDKRRNFGKQDNGKILYWKPEEEKEVELTPELEHAVDVGILEVVEKKKSKSSKKSSKKDDE